MCITCGLYFPSMAMINDAHSFVHKGQDEKIIFQKNQPKKKKSSAINDHSTFNIESENELSENESDHQVTGL